MLLRIVLYSSRRGSPLRKGHALNEHVAHGEGHAEHGVILDLIEGAGLFAQVGVEPLVHEIHEDVDGAVVGADGVRAVLFLVGVKPALFGGARLGAHGLALELFRAGDGVVLPGHKGELSVNPRIGKVHHDKAFLVDPRIPGGIPLLGLEPRGEPGERNVRHHKLFAHALGHFRVQIHLESHQFPVFHEGERRGRGVDRGTQFLAGNRRLRPSPSPSRAPYQAIAANKTRTCNRFIL